MTLAAPEIVLTVFTVFADAQAIAAAADAAFVAAADAAFVAAAE